jgi:hypothetical protein
MNNDHEFGLNIRRHLDQGTSDLDASVLRRLGDARLLAMNQQKLATAKGLSLAGVGMMVSESLLPRARMAMTVAAFMLGAVGTYYWNAFQQADENEEVDSALLADDLPVAAYTDQGFQAWLDRSSQSSSQ